MIKETIRKIFYHDKRLRGGWKVVLFFLFLIGAIAIGAGILLALISLEIISDPSTWDNEDMLLFTALLEGPAALLITFIFLFRGRISFRAIGLALHSQWFRELWLGMMIGFGLIAFIFLTGLTFGVLQTAWNGLSLSVMLSHGAPLFIMFGLQCATEELIFRGYPFQLSLASANPVAGIVIFSILFGVVHGVNPEITALGIVNTIMAGGLLSVAFLKTHSLWMPFGIHWGWNFSQGFLFSFPVSGVTFPPDVFSTVSTASQWITGGSFGPEGGAITFIVLGIAIIALYRSYRIEPEPSMQYGVAFPSTDQPGTAQ